MEQKYIGIIPYDENGDFEFAGRNEETWTLYDRIVRNDYTVYYAASGEGKSSLIRAGLLPILRRRNYFPVYIVFEDKEFENISSLDSIINNRIEIETERHNVSYEQSVLSKSYFTPEQSRELSENLWWRLRNYCFKRDDTELKPIFIFDQFEEVFTKANYEWTNRFFTWLEEISTDYVPNSLRDIIRGEIPVQKNFKALFSFRTEYLGDLDYWCVQKHFIPSLQENRMCLKPLTPNGAREVINLNDALEKYADKIVQGCAESGSNVENENQPCVYALILSVVCQTLSEMPDEERESFLKNLNADKDGTIDGILLRFYKKKLKDAGLDYRKDEKIIADIEDALVDEKGKRSRRDTNESSLLPLKEWIERLNDKKNGLIKEVGRKELNGEIIKTVEFPHDRLCRAIASSRKERQGKIAWKLKRQGEFMQFGIITVIMSIIAFLWNALMPALSPAMIYQPGETLDIFLKDYLKGKQSILGAFPLDESFSTLLLMILLLIFVPLIIIFVIRKGGKWQLLSLITSSISVIAFVLLLLRNTSIQFENSYVQIFTVIGLSVSLVSMVYSLTGLKALNSKKYARIPQENHYSFWPLWGGYFFFASYLFYETLCRVTFGINEPKDSCWALSLLPLLFFAWAWGFFNAVIEQRMRKKILFMILVSILLLIPLSVISYIPYTGFKQSYGMVVSLSLIILWISVFAYILAHVNSSSKYCLFTNRKRTIAVALGSFIILVTFFLNLGYNPLVISSNSVCHVTSWRSVVVNNDSLGSEKCDVVYSTDGKLIVPCGTPDSIKFSKGVYPFLGYNVPIISTFEQSPFEDNNFNQNIDKSLFWNSRKHLMTAYIQSAPTLEQYLNRMIQKKPSEIRNIVDSIDFYAAKMFFELRNANINFALTGDAYNVAALKSLNLLDSLQQVALSNELAMLKDSITFISNGYKRECPIAEVLEDKCLVDFHRELSRTFLLCLIRDRSSQSDMPAMFSLANMYLLTFFTSVPAMTMRVTADTYVSITTDKDIRTVRKTIYSDDILNGRLFAWYDLFNALCVMDINYNGEKYLKRTETIYEGLMKYETLTTVDKLKALEEMITLANYTFAVDNSIQQLKENVMHTLLPIMRSNGVYSNDFENVCRNLILASAFRGNNIKNDTLLFNNYVKEKNELYQFMTTGIDDNIIQSLQQLKSQIEERMRQEEELQAMINAVQQMIEKEKRKRDGELN